MNNKDQFLLLYLKENKTTEIYESICISPTLQINIRVYKNSCVMEVPAFL